jgi:chaperonin GroES
MNFTKITPLFNRVVVKRLLAPSKTQGGILLPEKTNTSQKVGMVTQVGPGKLNSNGVLIKTTINPGDYVLLPDYGGVKVPKSAGSDEEYTIYQEEDILGVVNKL